MNWKSLWIVFQCFEQKQKTQFIAENISFIESPCNENIRRKPRKYWEYT